MRTPLFVFAGVASLVLLSAASASNSPDSGLTDPETARVRLDSLADVRAFYAEFCATCHGENWEGGLAESLADGKWVYGTGDDQIASVILQGVEDEGMPAWEGILSEDQVQRMVVLIRSMERERARP